MNILILIFTLLFSTIAQAAPQRAILVDSSERVLGTAANPIYTSGGGGSSGWTTDSSTKTTTTYNVGIGTTGTNVGIGSYTSTMTLQTVGPENHVGAVNSSWPGWYDNLYKERYYGFTNYVSSEPVPSVYNSELVTTRGIIIDHNGSTAGRWGVHGFDYFGAEYGKRVSILAGYETDTGALYYFERKGQHYGKMRIGADLSGKGMTVSDTAVNFEGTDFTNAGFLSNPNATAIGIGTANPSHSLEVWGRAWFNTTYGNVGIGTANPGQTLDIVGTVRISTGTPGQAACYKSDSTLGQCTTVVGAGGGCTCS